jgi:hypothetical protein
MIPVSRHAGSWSDDAARALEMCSVKEEDKLHNEGGFPI